ncbi:MAG: FAD/NAD(P)-binding oxidoreductase [Bryobacteraceae bacterium]
MRLVIIGNGVAGITAALALREREQNAVITVISGESDFFFSRTALMYAFMDRMSLRDLEPMERRVYKAKEISRVRGWVVNLDSDKHSVTLASGESIFYDSLLLATGSLANQPEIEGLNYATEGVVNFVTLEDLGRCERQTRRGGRAVVIGGGLIGIELVECLAHHQMDVTFLIREPWYWPAALNDEEGTMVAQHLRRHGIQVILDESVTGVTVAKNGTVSGVCVASGTEYPCELLGIAVGVHPAVEWLAGCRTPPAIRRGVVVDAGFRTSLPDVFSAGDCAEIEIPECKPLIEQIWYSAKRQGELAAKSMLGDFVAYRPPVFYNSSKFFDIEFTTVGVCTPEPGLLSLQGRVLGRDISVRGIFRDDAAIGFNMLGSRWDHTCLERWISERRTPGYVIEHLGLAQFDVEFGKVDLRPVQDQLRRQLTAANQVSK